MAADLPSMSGGYPVRFEIPYPEGGNRFMILIRWLLAIPHLIILGILRYIAGVVLVLSFFAILFTGKYPGSLFRFQTGVLRWNYNVSAYIGFHNQYPPFGWNEGEYAFATFEVEHAAHYSRLLPFVKWLLAIPHVLILIVLGLISAVLWVFTIFAVLITGKYPRGAFDFIVGTSRWGARVGAYVLLLTDAYPPFSMK